jgi:hypothetical protein
MHVSSLEPTPFSPRALIELWEVGGNLPPAQRTLEILRRGFSDVSGVDWENLPLGWIQRTLVRFRVALYGPDFHLVDRCPHCREGVEFKLSEQDFVAPSGAAVVRASDEPLKLRRDKWSLAFRLPTLADWKAAADQTLTPDEAGRFLLTRCLLSVKQGSHKASAETIPGDLWEALAQSVAENDPWSELLFNLKCPKCEEAWESVFEPGDYLWREIGVTARRLLRQVHLIARAYGWSEEQILSVPPERRGAYLAMIQEDFDSDRDLAYPPYRAAEVS